MKHSQSIMLKTKKTMAKWQATWSGGGHTRMDGAYVLGCSGEGSSMLAFWDLEFFDSYLKTVIDSRLVSKLSGAWEGKGLFRLDVYGIQDPLNDGSNHMKKILYVSVCTEWTTLKLKNNYLMVLKIWLHFVCFQSKTRNQWKNIIKKYWKKDT